MMNKIIRAYKAIKSEKYLIILLPIALSLVPIIILIKHLILLRFGLIHSDRMGHFITDTALYLIEKKKIECYSPNMTWNDSQENTKILTEWKGYI